MMISASATATWVARGLVFTIAVAMLASVVLVLHVGQDKDELAARAIKLQYQQHNVRDRRVRIDFEEMDDDDRSRNVKEEGAGRDQEEVQMEEGEEGAGENVQMEEEEDDDVEEEAYVEEEEDVVVPTEVEEEEDEDEEEAADDEELPVLTDEGEDSDDVEYDEAQDFDEYMDEDNKPEDDEEAEPLGEAPGRVEEEAQDDNTTSSQQPTSASTSITAKSAPVRKRPSSSDASNSSVVATTAGRPKANTTTNVNVSPRQEAPALKKRLPDCLIIGVRKGGTRALMHFLLMNQQVASLGPELGFFINEERYALGLDWYRDQMPPVQDDQVLIEKSADYFQYDVAPERVHKMNSSIKLVLVVRDPIERLISDYHFIRRYATMNNITDYNFMEVNHTLEELLVNATTGELRYDHGGLYRSRYSKFLKNWQQWFPSNQIHIVDGDRFARDNPAIELQRLERFLGVTPVMTEDKFYYSYDKGYWCLRDTGCLGSEKGHKFSGLDPKLHFMLKNYFRAFNSQFVQMTDMDIRWND